MSRKTSTARTRAKTPSGEASYGLGKEIAGIAEALEPLYHLEASADNLGSLATALDSVSHTIAMSVIAEHGSTEDRAKAVEHLKGWFWQTDVFRQAS